MFEIPITLDPKTGACVFVNVSPHPEGGAHIPLLRFALSSIKQFPPTDLWRMEGVKDFNIFHVPIPAPDQMIEVTFIPNGDENGKVEILDADANTILSVSWKNLADGSRLISNQTGTILCSTDGEVSEMLTERQQSLKADASSLFAQNKIKEALDSLCEYIYGDEDGD